MIAFTKVVYSWIERFIKRHPLVTIIFASLFLLRGIIWFGPLIYGDIPLFSVHFSRPNFLYAWGGEQLGTSVRQSLNTLRDIVLLFFSFHDTIYFFLKYVLPILLLPVTYFYLLKRLGITRTPALILGSLFPLFMPVVFGDFLTGQTFWIYLTIPWVYYFAIKLFCFNEFSFKNAVLLGVWLFLSLGMLPPIIVPVMVSIILLALVTFCLLLFERKAFFWKFIKTAMVTGGVFLLLSAPYVLVASSGQAAFTPPSLLGDYYHNYAVSGLENTFRLAGNNGNGQATLLYNDSQSLTNLVGYMLLAFIVFGALAIGIQRANRRYRALLIGLLIIILPVLGLMHLLNSDTVFGVKVFETQWIVSTIRSPSKLYNLLLPVFVILFAFAIQQYALTIKKRLVYGSVLAGSVVLVGLYGWPAWRGDLGLLYGREDKLANYKPDTVVSEAVTQMQDKTDRSVFMPADHRDELNYQYIAPGLNVLRLEGGMPGTSALLRAVNEDFNNQNPYFFNYLQAIGVKNVFLQKDQAAYEAAQFGLFSVKSTPEQARKFLKTGTQEQSGSESLWHFTTTRQSPLVYSPKQLVITKSASDIRQRAPFLQADTAVLDELPESLRGQASVYNIQHAVAPNTVLANGRAQLHNPELLTADIFKQSTNEGEQMVIDVVNPLNGSLLKTVTTPLRANETVAYFGNDRYLLSDKKQRIHIQSGEYDVALGTIEAIAFNKSVGSFEGSKLPLIIDANPRTTGKPDLYTEFSSDASEGKQSLAIGSRNHRGFVQVTLPTDDQQSDYMLELDQKNNKGRTGDIIVRQQDKSITLSKSVVSSTREWQPRTVFFRPQTNSSVQAFLYVENDGKIASETIIDNLRLSKIKQTSSQTVTLPSYQPDYEYKQYRPQSQPDVQSENLLPNSSFEAGTWGQAEDGSKNSAGTSRIRAETTNDAAEGKFALRLSSQNHTAFVSQPIDRFDKNRVYKVSFRYKHISGRAPSFAIWQSGAAISKPTKSLEKKKDWTYFETYFVPDRAATNLSVYFYAYSNGEDTVNLYDDVQVTQVSPVESYIDKSEDTVTTPNAIVTSFSVINPTLIKVNVSNQAGVVVLNQSFHQGWRAYAVRDDEQETLAQKLFLQPPGELIPQHVMANGFANAWVVEPADIKQSLPENYTIVLRYEPQKFLYGGLIVSGLTTVTITAYLYIDFRKRKKVR